MTSLAGRKVLITRAIDDSEPLVEQLRRAGAETVVFPCISIQYLKGDRTRERLLAALEEASWVAFTSRRAVRAVAAVMQRLPEHIRVAAVGESTGVEAADLLGRCDCVSTSGTGRSLGQDLKVLFESEGVSGATVLIPAAENGRHDLEKELETAGHHAWRVEVYRTLPVAADSTRMNLEEIGIDTVILASPSATTGLLNQAIVPESVRIVTIGTTTSEAVRQAGLSVAAEAVKPSIDELLKVV